MDLTFFDYRSGKMLEDKSKSAKRPRTSVENKVSILFAYDGYPLTCHIYVIAVSF